MNTIHPILQAYDTIWQCKQRHLVDKFEINQITQVKDSIALVRCASGNVFSEFSCQNFLWIIFGHFCFEFFLEFFLNFLKRIVLESFSSKICLQKFFLELTYFILFSCCFDISGSMIRLSVPEMIKLNSRVVLDGACDDDYDDL